MKNTIFLAAAAFLCSAANAQTDTTTKPPAVENATTVTATTSITVPDHLKGVSSNDIRPEHYLPVLGNFTPSGSSSANLTITVDEQNIGIVWIDGLPQGRIKALLKKSPATYKIPAQKTAEGKSVSGGTLIFDPATKEINIVLGKAFNDANPAAALATQASGKSKAFVYTGAKADATAMQMPISQ
jgi:hypothetical protein